MHRIILFVAGLAVAAFLATTTALASLAPPPEPTRPGTIPCAPVQGQAHLVYLPFIVSLQPEVWAAIPQEK